MSLTQIVPTATSAPVVTDRPRSFTFTARGLPAAQGSKSFKGFANGHALLVESSKAVKPWRQDVVAAAADEIDRTPGFRTFDGPVHLIIEFYMPRPKSDAKRRRTVPAKTPDLSKLIRSTEDAMTTAGVWKDDALVVDMTIRKRYAVQDPALGHDWELPGIGAVVTVIEVDPEDTWSDTPLAHHAHDRFRAPALPAGVREEETVREHASVVDLPAEFTDARLVKIVARALDTHGEPVVFDVREIRDRVLAVPGAPLTALQQAIADACTAYRCTVIAR